MFDVVNFAYIVYYYIASFREFNIFPISCVIADLSPEDLLKQPKLNNQSNQPQTEATQGEPDDSESHDPPADVQSDEIIPVDAPDIDTQKKELQAVLKQILKKGDTW